MTSQEKTNDMIVPYLTDNVYKNSPVLTRLKSKRRFEFTGGRTIMHNIMYAELKGGAYQRGQAFDTFRCADRHHFCSSR